MAFVVVAVARTELRDSQFAPRTIQRVYFTNDLWVTTKSRAERFETYDAANAICWGLIKSKTDIGTHVFWCEEV